MSDNAKSKILITGLWANKTKEGDTYYTGPLSYGAKLILFKNVYKQGDDKKPDLLLYVVPGEKKEEKKTEKAGDDGEIPF